MARIPRYGGPQVQATNLPNVRLSDNMPAPDTSGLQAVAGVFGKIAQAEQDKANTAAQMEIENQLAGLENSTLYDADSGFLNRQGKDAIGVQEQFTPTWERGQAQIVASAPRHLRQWAEQAAGRRRQGADRILMRHSMRESERYYEQQTASLVASATDTAVLNYLDPERVNEEAARAMIAVDRRADLSGMDEITRGRLRKAAASGINRAVLERLATDDPSAALSRMEQLRDTLTGEDVTALERTLRPVIAHTDASSWIDAQLSGRPVAAGAMPVADAAGSLTQAEAVARASVGRTVGLESGGDAAAKNPRSSATGPAQFVDETWLEMLRKHRPDLAALPRPEALGLRTDPDLSKAMAEAYAVENARGLYESGLPVTEQTVYMAHHFGLGGARALLRADPDARVASILPARDVRANPYLKDMTVADLVENHQRRAGEAVVPASAAVPARAADGSTDWVEMERRASALPNPVLRQAALTEITRRRGLEDRARTAREGELWDSAYTKLNSEDPFTPLEKLLSPQELNLAKRENRVETMRNLLEVRQRGGLIQTDPVLLEQLHDEAQRDPEKFLNRGRAGILALGDRIAPADRDRVFGWMEALRPDAADGKRGDWSTTAERIDQQLSALGLSTAGDASGRNSGDKNEDRKRMRGEFRIAYNNAERAFAQQNGGKKPTPEQADVLARSVARTFAQHMAEERTSLYTSAAAFSLEVSEAERLAVRQAYRQKYGVEPTDAYVIQYMARVAQQQRGGGDE